MTFDRVNEHILRCVLHENEISQMGYNLGELLHDQELASSFLKDIIEKANEAGFPIDENHKVIQSLLLPDHQIVLNIMDLSMEESLNEMIQNYLKAYDAVSMIGRDRLEELMKLTGQEKVQAFQKYMAKIQEMNGNIPDTKEQIFHNDKDASIQMEPDHSVSNEKYLLWFRNLDETERFCKEAAVVVPGRLYKAKKRYCMLIDVRNVEQAAMKGFLLKALEYTLRIQADHINSAYLEEHAEIIIKENPIEVLKSI